MSWNEEQKGYFGTNPQNDAQQRGWDRAQQHKAAAAEAAEADAARRRVSSDEAFRSLERSLQTRGGQPGGHTSSVGSAGWRDFAHAWAVIGAIVGVGYGLWALPGLTVAGLLVPGLAGAAAGAVTGVALCAALALLRLALVISGWALLALGVLWLLTKLG